VSRGTTERFSYFYYGYFTVKNPISLTDYGTIGAAEIMDRHPENDVSPHGYTPGNPASDSRKQSDFRPIDGRKPRIIEMP
jgi:hypothetical protein